MGCGIRLEDGVFVNGLECCYTGWAVSKRDGVLVFGMVCSYTDCGVSILDGVLKNRTGINIQGELLVYRLVC